jgi:phospholipase/carboxylesterase
MTAGTTAPDFIHRFIPARKEGLAPLLLLHGTGGDENDLLPIAQAVAPDRAVLSPRGKVLEGTMPRFFCRLAEGVFDEVDVVRRAHELVAFVEASKARYGIGAPIALGFSNGANIAAAMLMLEPDGLAGAVLIRAMTPLHATATKPNLTRKPVLMLSGAMDPIIAARDSENLARQLKENGAHLRHEVLPSGHGLTQADIRLSEEFLAVLP